MRHRHLALGLLFLLGSSACAEDVVSHADPPCAFDETGCVPAELELRVEATEDGPSAVLRATSPLEGNSWVQNGVRGLEDLVLRGETVPVAPRVELSVRSDADRVSVEIARGGSRHGREDFQPIAIHSAPSVLPLEPGVYVLRVRASWPQDEVVFYFTVRRV